LIDFLAYAELIWWIAVAGRIKQAFFTASPVFGFPAGLWILAQKISNRCFPWLYSKEAEVGWGVF
jgi:hypothetical protein